ncbi:MAG: hypothetical protein LBS01_07345, partial [Prevotellaceae bacterium]|nr:hypothetical protein [Prevotellaceae bacterium]
ATTLMVASTTMGQPYTIGVLPFQGLMPITPPPTMLLLIPRPVTSAGSGTGCAVYATVNLGI